MSQIKSLGDRIREAQQGIPVTKTAEKETRYDIEEETNTKTNKRKEVSKDKPATVKKSTQSDGDGDIVDKINHLIFDNERQVPKQVPIRFPASIYSKMNLLSNERLSIQKFTVFAVSQLLESPEIKKKLKIILKKLNEQLHGQHLRYTSW